MFFSRTFSSSTKSLMFFFSVQPEDEMDSWPSGATPGTGLTTTQHNTIQHNLSLLKCWTEKKKRRRKKNEQTKKNEQMKAKNIKSNNNMISHNLRPKVFSLLYFSLFSLSVMSVRNADSFDFWLKTFGPQAEQRSL